jgi:hypothetical protein
MPRTYQITSLAGGFGSLCPPPIVTALWPTFEGWPVSLSENEMTVTVPDTAPTPADLGPLVKVELVQSE